MPRNGAKMLRPDPGPPPCCFYFSNVLHYLSAMHRFFWVFQLLNVIFFVFVSGLATAGHFLGSRAYFHAHIFAGIMVASTICLIHFLVMFHFIGSGVAVKEAVEHDEREKKKSVYLALRKYKGKTFPYALFSMIAMVFATVSGGAVHTGRWPLPVHVGIVFASFILNFRAGYVEYEYLRLNSELIDQLDAEQQQLAGQDKKN